MSTVDEVYDAIAAGDFALAEELTNSITDPRELNRMSNEFAVAAQYTWSDELHRRSDELRQGFFPEPFRFYPEGEPLP